MTSNIHQKPKEFHRAIFWAIQKQCFNQYPLELQLWSYGFLVVVNDIENYVDRYRDLLTFGDNWDLFGSDCDLKTGANTLKHWYSWNIENQMKRINKLNRAHWQWCNRHRCTCQTWRISPDAMFNPTIFRIRSLYSHADTVQFSACFFRWMIKSINQLNWITFWNQCENHFRLFHNIISFE